MTQPGKRWPPTECDGLNGKGRGKMINSKLFGARTQSSVNKRGDGKNSRASKTGSESEGSSLFTLRDRGISTGVFSNGERKAPE